jgi:hypothetical protein
LTGVGLQYLLPVLRNLKALEVLGLSDVGLCDTDSAQLQALVAALVASPAAVREVDLDANYFGEMPAGHCTP